MNKQALFVWLSLVVAVVVGARSRSSDQVASSTISSVLKKDAQPTPIPILRQINEILEDGSYRFGYEGGDGTFRIETRQPDGTVRGKYGFRDADGQIRVVDYSATNETGFDAQGEHIPKGPPPARASENDFEDDEEAFTTQRTRPKTRPSPRPRPQPTTRPRPRPRPRPTTSSPRPRPPPPPPPPMTHQQSFEDEIDDETRDFLLHQSLSASRIRTRPSAPTVISHQLPVAVPRPQATTSRRPLIRPNIVVTDQSFEFESEEEPPRAVTAVQQTGGRPAVARPLSSIDTGFSTHQRPFSSGVRAPPPKLDDFLFPSGVEVPRPPPVARRPKPVEVSPIDTDPLDETDDDHPHRPTRVRSGSSPGMSFVQRHQLPVHVPQQRDHEARGGVVRGSFIDDFLATHPPPSARPPPPPTVRRPVFDEDVFNFRERSRVRDPTFDFRDRNHNSRARLQDLGKQIGTSHGFVFQANPSSSDSGRFDESVQLIQTVPGSLDPIFHHLGF